MGVTWQGGCSISPRKQAEAGSFIRESLIDEMVSGWISNHLPAFPLPYTVHLGIRHSLAREAPSGVIIVNARRIW